MIGLDGDAIQYHRFPNGGFVLHRVHASAWYGATGALLAAEAGVGERKRNVKQGGPVWRYLQAVGRRYERA